VSKEGRVLVIQAATMIEQIHRPRGITPELINLVEESAK
jgi:hypothetical protein